MKNIKNRTTQFNVKPSKLPKTKKKTDLKVCQTKLIRGYLAPSLKVLVPFPFEKRKEKKLTYFL
jgi:hypothetical protein